MGFRDACIVFCCELSQSLKHIEDSIKNICAKLHNKLQERLFKGKHDSEEKQHREKDQTQQCLGGRPPQVTTINDFFSCGLPNLGQSCYMNSALQGLLTLKAFLDDIKRQKMIWHSLPDADIIRNFVKVAEVSNFEDQGTKFDALRKLKKAVSQSYSQFEDNRQKDTHEFLTCMLHQISSLSPILGAIGDSMGVPYTCPVGNHMGFEMLNTRTCIRYD
ncbi:ubiquitin carboxyl-terminal hydrolase 37-like [Thalassophryne amazonica]|uniref:ubiquitin carboxyl-terminal hydrolase 37-like n=1 Tax=Thalassophryne amazonica TaxID=390379 RepID=UPI001472048C|nr:ubiquitin carboxyl-terminal hydrolase 37-like [Thalassophryne amazonica]